MATTPNALEKPTGVAPAEGEPVIHVIPDKFYGSALRKKVREMPIQTGVTPPGPRAPAPPGAPLPSKPKGKKWILLAVLAVVLLGAIGGAVYVFTRPAKKPEVAAVVPPPTVCGDGRCESPKETPQNCSADCGPPPPVCGDKKCDATESPQTCPGDCGPPPPVCGDGKCETPETYEACPADCKPPEPKPGIDTDSDGLSDQEELEVFGTSPTSPNSDGDSYVDLNEALNLFDPAKPTPALLKDNPHISIYSNAAQNYVIYRPTAWSVKDADDPEKKTVFFNAPSGEFIEVLIQDKQAKQSLMDWYLSQAPGVTSSQVESYKTKMGYDAILSPDRMNAYVDFGDKAVVVSYNLGKQLIINYRVTFQVMVTSLKKLK